MSEKIRLETRDDCVRVRVKLDSSAPLGTETLICERLPGRPGEYRVAVIPFFAVDIAYQDEIATQVIDGFITFVRVVKPSGQSTIQVLFGEGIDDERIRSTLRTLEEKGLGCGRFGPGYCVVTVKSSSEAVVFLEIAHPLKAQGVLDFAIPPRLLA